MTNFYMKHNTRLELVKRINQEISNTWKYHGTMYSRMDQV